MRSAAGARGRSGAGAAATAALTTAAALARPAAPGAGPGAAVTARIRAFALGSGAVLNETDFSTVHFCAVELLQGPLHVRVEPELDHPLIPSALVGVSVSHLSCLPHVVLQVLPAAAAGKILNNEPIICPYRWAISVSSPAPISTF